MAACLCGKNGFDPTLVQIEEAGLDERDARHRGNSFLQSGVGGRDDRPGDSSRIKVDQGRGGVKSASAWLDFMLRHRISLRGMSPLFGKAALSGGKVVIRKLQRSDDTQAVPSLRMGLRRPCRAAPQRSTGRPRAWVLDQDRRRRFLGSEQRTEIKRFCSGAATAMANNWLQKGQKRGPNGHYFSGRIISVHLQCLIVIIRIMLF